MFSFWNTVLWKKSIPVVERDLRGFQCVNFLFCSRHSCSGPWTAPSPHSLEPWLDDAAEKRRQQFQGWPSVDRVAVQCQKTTLGSWMWRMKRKMKWENYNHTYKHVKSLKLQLTLSFSDLISFREISMSPTCTWCRFIHSIGLTLASANWSVLPAIFLWSRLKLWWVNPFSTLIYDFCCFQSCPFYSILFPFFSSVLMSSKLLAVE